MFRIYLRYLPRLCSGHINGRIFSIFLGSRYIRTNERAPFFFLFFIFIFLPSSRVDLFKGPHLIDPRDPGATCLDVCGINRATPGDLCSRLAGMKRAETRKSKSFRHSRVSLTPTIHRDENVAWKNRYFSTYANLQKVIPCFYRIIVFYTELMDS